MTLDLKKSTVILFSTLAVIIVFVVTTFIYLINQQENDGEIINIAGRQRMLSQKISKLSLQIFQDSLSNTTPEYSELKKSINLFEKSHYKLKANDSSGFKNVKSDTLIKMFDDIQTSFDELIGNAKIILKQESYQKNELNKILKNEKIFLPKMNAIVFQYDKENREKINRLKRIMFISTIIFILVLLTELIFIILPALKENKKNNILLEEKAQKIQEKNEEILASEEELRQNNEELLALAENNENQKKQLEKDAKSLRGQAALAKILEKSTSLTLKIDDFLQEALDILLELPWLNIVSKGSVFLTDKDGNLKMVAQKDLGILTKMCALINPGQCLCGKALSQQKTLFSNHVNHHEHDIHPEGMQEHGHYNIPIKIKDKVLGVLNLYVPHKHIQTDEELIFLESVTDTLASVIHRAILQDEIKAKSEQLLKYYTVIEQSPVTIVFSNTKGVIEYANPQFSKLTGYDTKDIIGKNLSILNSGKTPKKVFEDLWQTISKGETWEGEFINKKKNGEEFIERATISPLRNKKGEIYNYITIKEDITELKAAQDALKKLNESLQDSIRITQQQKQEIERTHKNITDSINYAKNIQQALLPTKQIETELNKEHLILFKPKETVSGDFYYFHKDKNRILFAAADCTGHGVPGAFMTLLSITFLNGLVKRRHNYIPSEILEQLRNLIIGIFSEESQNQNGLDIALCSVDTETNILQYAGAYNPLWIVRDGKLLEYKATKAPIGNHPRFLNFKNHEIQLQNNDLIYIFSDGYHDQLGGAHNRKFTKKRFRELILEIKDMPLDEQKQILEDILIKWRANIEQVDDVVIMAVKWEINKPA